MPRRSRLRGDVGRTYFRRLRWAGGFHRLHRASRGRHDTTASLATPLTSDADAARWRGNQTRGYRRAQPVEERSEPRGTEDHQRRTNQQAKRADPPRRHVSWLRPRRRHCAVRCGTPSRTSASPCASRNRAQPLPRDPLFATPQRTCCCGCPLTHRRAAAHPAGVVATVRLPCVRPAGSSATRTSALLCVSTPTNLPPHRPPPGRPVARRGDPSTRGPGSPATGHRAKAGAIAHHQVPPHREVLRQPPPISPAHTDSTLPRDCATGRPGSRPGPGRGAPAARPRRVRALRQP